MNTPKHKHPHPSSQSGYTILESLMAIVVVTVLMVAVAPLLAFSFATRVQAKRVELGSKAANTYIDAVRSGAVTPTLTTQTDPPTSAGSLTCDAGQVCTSPAGLYCVDNDSDGKCTLPNDPTPGKGLMDMIVQGVAINKVAGATLEDGYQLIVRVYRSDAFKDSNLLQKGKLQSTKGLGNPKVPLSEITTQIIIGGQTSFQDIENRLTAP
ncbi:hormogonium polysaccharide secretion pseudopilin HpsB [Planktothrix agardhii]|uniref:hormogonium polysaccharide secretion pseudopilin HpsB n=1 Tax=Planktothrix agardhii TaxID=1160 RepID=UPI001D0B0CC5|nr:hormogonium polysaccharide secretion pseudopilin HpsB [Planktothrix agardhii]MCB8788400.1 hormogonium polysaccharide secretion pseudopilin HpsB [Planktothrix agardhii 1025]MCF3609820.1 hormogonium polysaccharide secretion pseudopilin HpsB [Planktothrix agardhii 1027]